MTLTITPLDKEGRPSGEPVIIQAAEFTTRLEIEIPAEDEDPIRPVIWSEPKVFTLRFFRWGRGRRQDLDRLVGLTPVLRSRSRRKRAAKKARR